jgi:single-stranded-DNA-specific exonuclease
MNRARQEIEHTTLEAARALAAPLNLADTWGVALGATGWHPGVIGIVASRLVEELARPVVMVAFDEGVGKGSGRSIPAFDLHAGLSACSDLFDRFGGHKAAAGITIQESRMAEFQERFNAIAHERLTADDLVPEIRVDVELTVDDVTSDLEALLRHFEPFGMGNPSPQLAVRGAQVVGAPRGVGKNGLKCWLGSRAGPLEALGWGMADRLGEFGAGDTVDVAFKLERDSYRGTSKLVARLTDVRF